MSAAYENLLAFIAASLTQPVEERLEDDAMTLTGGDPPEVIVRLTPSRVDVFEYAFEWDGPHSGHVTPIRVGVLYWTKLDEEAVMRAVKALIVGARNVRLSKFRACRICEQRRPPEWMHDEEVCQGCAEGQLGVVH